MYCMVRKLLLIRVPVNLLACSVTSEPTLDTSFAKLGELYLSIYKY